MPGESNQQMESPEEATTHDEHCLRFEGAFQEALSRLGQLNPQHLINFTVLAQTLAKKTVLAECLRSRAEDLGSIDSYEAFRLSMHLMWTRLLIAAVTQCATGPEGLAEGFVSALTSYLGRDSLYREAFAGRVSILIKRSCLVLFMLLDCEEFHRIVHSVNLQVAHSVDGRRRANTRLGSGQARPAVRRREGTFTQKKK